MKALTNWWELLIIGRISRDSTLNWRHLIELTVLIKSWHLLHHWKLWKRRVWVEWGVIKLLNTIYFSKILVHLCHLSNWLFVLRARDAWIWFCSILLASEFLFNWMEACIILFNLGEFLHIRCKMGLHITNLRNKLSKVGGVFNLVHKVIFWLKVEGSLGR